MNAIEMALQKTATREVRKERQLLALPKTPEPVNVLPEVEMTDDGIYVPKVPKEKTNAEIRVQVSYPSGGFEFTLIKDNVLANVPKHRLTAAEFAKAFKEGLMPIIGAVK